MRLKERITTHDSISSPNNNLINKDTTLSSEENIKKKDFKKNKKKIVKLSEADKIEI